MFDLLKLILKLFSVEPNIPLIPKTGPSPSTKKLLLGLLARVDELLLTPKIITFLAVSLLKLHEPALSNIIP